MEQRYIIFQGITNKSGQNNASKSQKIWGFYSACFAFGKSIRKIKTMVQYQKKYDFYRGELEIGCERYV